MVKKKYYLIKWRLNGTKRWRRPSILFDTESQAKKQLTIIRRDMRMIYGQKKGRIETTIKPYTKTRERKIKGRLSAYTPREVKQQLKKGRKKR